jgi:HK97 family phage prohead protease
MQELEQRSFQTELRASPQGIIRGYSILFNSESLLLGDQFTEIIKPEACQAEFMSKQNIVMRYNHEANSILARYRAGSYKNTLRFSTDSSGVQFEFQAKKADEWLIESIRANDLNGCSFAFSVNQQGQKFEKKPNGKYLRTITKFDSITDFSIVINPAYSATEQTLSARALELTKPRKSDAELLREYDKMIAKERYSQDFRTKADADAYWKNYHDRINKLKL